MICDACCDGRDPKKPIILRFEMTDVFLERVQKARERLRELEGEGYTGLQLHTDAFTAHYEHELDDDVLKLAGRADYDTWKEVGSFPAPEQEVEHRLICVQRHGFHFHFFHDGYDWSSATVLWEHVPGGAK